MQPVTTCVIVPTPVCNIGSLSSKQSEHSFSLCAIIDHLNGTFCEHYCEQWGHKREREGGLGRRGEREEGRE